MWYEKDNLFLTTGESQTKYKELQQNKEVIPYTLPTWTKAT